jgi:hypothetical protein
MRKWIYGIWGLMLLLLGAVESSAYIDALQLNLLNHRTLPLRWNHIEGGEEAFLEGPQPRFMPCDGLHAVPLTADQPVLIKIPPHESLRVEALRKGETLEKLDISLSNGSGMHVLRRFPMDEKRRSLWVPPAADDPLLCRIALKPPDTLMTEGTDNAAVLLALFLSTHKPLGTIAPCRHPLPLNAPLVRVAKDRAPGAERFCRLSSGRPARVRVQGPVRVAVETRLLYPETESARRIRYYLPLLLDAAPFTVLDFETRPLTSDGVRVDRKPVVCGVAEKAFFHIPAGEHVLTLLPQTELLVRLNALSHPDYLLPALNAPDDLEPQLKALQRRFETGGILTGAELMSAVDQVAHPADIEKIARHVVRQNHFPQGGLLGVALMEQQAACRPDTPQVRTAARHLAADHTFYRNLLPTVKPLSSPQQTLSFVLPRLQREADGHQVAARQHGKALQNQLQSACFNVLPAPEDHAAASMNREFLSAGLGYDLPERNAPSMLRIVATRPECPEWFFLQLDDGPVQRFCVLPRVERPMDEFRLTGAEAGLRLQQVKGVLPAAAAALIRSVSPDASIVAETDGAPWPRPWFLPAFFEIPLPSGVSRVTLRTDSPSCCKVALQYRASVIYRMSETEYLQAIEYMGTETEVWKAFVHLLGSQAMDTVTKEHPGAADSMALQDLSNFWWPAVRLIRARHATFVAAQRGAVSLFETRHALPEAQLRRLVEQARSFKSQVSPLTALETWSRIFYASTGALRDQAAFEMVKALIASGETYLAEVLLRNQMLQAEDPGAAEKAFARLDAFYRRGRAPERLLPLYAARSIFAPTPAHLRMLAEQLFKDGYQSEAFMIVLALPAAERPLDVLLQSCRVMGWQRMYQQQVAALPEGETKRLWQARAWLDRGYPAAAEVLLPEAGDRGKMLSKALEEGRRIRRALDAPDRWKRRQAIVDWETWQADLSVEYEWQNSGKAVEDYDGSLTLYNRPRDLWFHMYRVTKERPLTARLYGPCRVRLTVRALHPAGSDAGVHSPQDTWVRIHQGKEEILVPITGSVPAEGLRSVEAQAGLPGRQISVPLVLEPGVNPLKIYAEDMPLLVQLEVRRPRIPGNVLPQLMLENVARVLQGKPVVEKERYPAGHGCDCMHSDCLKMLLQDGGVRKEPLSVVRQHIQPVAPLSETDIQWEKLTALRKFRGQSPMPLDPAQVIFEDMHRLVRRAETDPENILAYETEARRLFEKNSHLIGLKPLYNRIRRHTAWESCELVEADAGLRGVPVEGWQPASKALRVRKALLPEAPSPEESVIRRSADLVLFMKNPVPLRLRCELSLNDLPMLSAAPLVAFYRLDDGLPSSRAGTTHEIMLTRERPQHVLDFTVPAGRRRLTLGISRGYANQFVTARFLKFVSPGTYHPLALKSPEERLYYVATTEQPVRVKIKGPSWLQIDEWREGRSRIRSQAVAPGWQTVELKPSGGRTEGLFRVQRRVLQDREAPDSRPRPVTIPYDETDVPPFTLRSTALPTLPSVVHFRDDHDREGHEDGTASVSFKYRKRLNFEEGEEEDEESHTYEISAVYDKFASSWPGYFQTGILGRFRQDTGGPTLGLWEDLLYHPERLPLTMQLESRLYLQQPDAGRFAFSGSETTEYGALLKGTLSQKRTLGLQSYHIPAVSIFGRLLSLDDDDTYDAGRIDRDVFTGYKHDHRQGASLSDSLAWRPWLDTLWYVKGSLHTNEDFNILHPDHIRMKVGWKQLLYPLVLDLDYRYTYYFSDKDRDGELQKNILGLDVLWHHWLQDQQRFRLHMAFAQDLDQNEFSALIGGTWFFSRGQALKNIRARDMDFEDQYQLSIPQNMNSLVGP